MILRFALAGVRERPLRSLLIGLAITLGVGIFGGTLVYADTARAAFLDDLGRGARGIDVIATPTGDGGPAGDAVAAVSQLPDVVHTDLRAYAQLGVIGRNGRVLLNAGRTGLAVQAPSWAGFAPYVVAAGHPPTHAGELALDVPTAHREGFATGDVIRVIAADGSIHDLNLVGLVDFGVSADYADQSVAVLGAEDLARYATPTAAPSVLVAARPGADQAALAGQVRERLGAGYTVATGAELRIDLATAAAKYVSGFLTTLRVAAIVALAATMLVVYNTFQIVAVQRRREYALLRCVGAGRGHLIRLVLAESLLLGLAGGIGAVGAGVLAGLALAVAQDVLGGGLPDFHLVVTPLAVLAPLAVALVATAASAVVPAVIAGRTAPVAAARAATALVRRRPLVRLAIVTALLGIAAVGLLLMWSGRGQGFDGLPAVAGGGMIVFAAVTLALPFVITWLNAPLRRLLGGSLGAAGRMAADNARRHPVRSAATTAALVVALAPMATLAVLLTTARTQTDRELAENFPVDYVVSDATDAAHPFSPDVVDRLRADPAFGLVAIARSAWGHADGLEAHVGSIEPGVVGSKLALEVRAGDPAGLAAGTVAVRERFATDNGLGLGDVVTLAAGDAGWRGRIVAIYDNTPLDVDVLTSWSDFGSGAIGEQLLLIRRADGVSAADASRALDRGLQAQPFAGVTSVADRRETLANSIGRRLTQFNVLFGVSVVIGLLGIVNALYLAVAERTAESGLLRAMGLSRRQLFGMLVIEAEISAVVGSAVGVLFGVGLGWVASRQLIEFYGHGLPSIPIGTITIYALAAAVGAAVAALVPARRAARSAPVDAMREV